jgi:MoaA/NifB/PqqE/SkfB family radical SAM enzyme
VVLTGGEPFLRCDLIRTVLSWCDPLDATVSVMTSAYWATSDAAAANALQRVQGIRCLIVSIDRYHDECRPRARSIRAIAAAAGAGIREVILQVTLTESGDVAELEQVLQPFADLASTAGAVLSYSINYLVPAGRAASLARVRALPASEFDRPCLALNGLSVRPNGNVHGCCGPIGFTSLRHPDPLLLGNLEHQSWDQIRAVYRRSKLISLLRTLGPYQAIRILEEGFGITTFEDRRYSDICDVCTDLLADSRHCDLLLDFLKSPPRTSGVCLV